MKFNYASRSDIGRRRQQNQDSCSTHPDIGLFIVADGMGGHLGGGTASAMVVGIIPEKVKNGQKKKTWDPKKLITDAIKDANEAIYARASSDSSLQGMGTTTTALLFTEGALSIGHVGDSRCYYYRDENSWQITRDHSLVEEKLKAGLITREQLKTDSMKNVITRSVGFEATVEVDVYEMEVQSGDLFLICSDGLSGLVDEKMMTQIINDEVFEKKELESAVERLIHQANENGGDDNITAVLIQIA